MFCPYTNKRKELFNYEKIKDSRFKQQRLPAWRPVPTIMTIVIVFSIFGLVFIILGIILFYYCHIKMSSRYFYIILRLYLLISELSFLFERISFCISQCTFIYHTLAIIFKIKSCRAFRFILIS